MEVSWFLGANVITPESGLGVDVAVTLLPMLIHTCINPHTTKVLSDCTADIIHMSTLEFAQPSHMMKNTSNLLNSGNLWNVVTADPMKVSSRQSVYNAQIIVFTIHYKCEIMRSL